MVKCDKKEREREIREVKWEGKGTVKNGGKRVERKEGRESYVAKD